MVIICCKFDCRPLSKTIYGRYKSIKLGKLFTINIAMNNYKYYIILFQVEYSGGYEIINPHRFGQQFVGRVANSKDLLLFYKKKTYTGGSNDFELKIFYSGIFLKRTPPVQNLSVCLIRMSPS